MPVLCIWQHIPNSITNNLDEDISVLFFPDSLIKKITLLLNELKSIDILAGDLPV